MKSHVLPPPTPIFDSLNSSLSLSLSLSPPHPTREHLTLRYFPLLQLIRLVASPCIILFSSSHHTHVSHLLGLSCLQLNFFLSFKSLTAINSHIYFIIYSIFHRIKFYFYWVITRLLKIGTGGGKTQRLCPEPQITKGIEDWQLQCLYPHSVQRGCGCGPVPFDRDLSCRPQWLLQPWCFPSLSDFLLLFLLLLQFESQMRSFNSHPFPGLARWSWALPVTFLGSLQFFPSGTPHSILPRRASLHLSLLYLQKATKWKPTRYVRLFHPLWCNLGVLGVLLFVWLLGKEAKFLCLFIPFLSFPLHFLSSQMGPFFSYWFFVHLCWEDYRLPLKPYFVQKSVSIVYFQKSALVF